MIRKDMSMDMVALVLPFEKMDAVWDRIIAAGPDGAADAMTAALNEFGAHERYRPNDGNIVDINEGLGEGKRRAMIAIAELDQELAKTLSPVSYQPEDEQICHMTLLALCDVSGIEGLDRDAGGTENVTTEQWISAFRSLTEERLTTMRQKLAHAFEWRWAWEVLQEVRNIAKYCHEHGAQMSIFTLGDAILTQPFTDRAERIYEKLAATWKK